MIDVFINYILPFILPILVAGYSLVSIVYNDRRINSIRDIDAAQFEEEQEKSDFKRNLEILSPEDQKLFKHSLDMIAEKAIPDEYSDSPVKPPEKALEARSVSPKVTEAAVRYDINGAHCNFCGGTLITSDGSTLKCTYCESVSPHVVKSPKVEVRAGNPIKPQAAFPQTGIASERDRKLGREGRCYKCGSKCNDAGGIAQTSDGILTCHLCYQEMDYSHEVYERLLKKTPWTAYIV